ncbi:unnamed protein product [Mytilus coruscus]|uniref:Mutator-like transposase domain-containing protein n=1 Tax=Mytilus coruscus TaxID=42192 RepID=A0A6J8BJ02_MYTCO|nr:unnamed protein product [Mytilus coruscus]
MTLDYANQHLYVVEQDVIFRINYDGMMRYKIFTNLRVRVEASFDGGWQKRGTGWQYDSNTGHASMIGLKTGKVMDYTYRSRSCRVCEVHEKRKETVSAHDCCRNWKGTSKGMEPDMAVEMTHKLNDSGCQIKVLHADNDSTTTSRLKVHFEDLEKKDDQNHVKKGFSKKLYELSKKYKELKHPDVIPYLVRCFMYAIKENEGLTDDLREGYKSLPGGKCLSNDALTSELRELVQQYNRRAESLQNMGSTQANENFNQIVGSKCPKARSYGGSSSFNSRLSAAVLQKNEGYTWLSMVNEASELSPGQFTMKQIPSSLTLSNTDKYVVFDLETTSLSRNSDITQLAAASGLNLFQRYIMPRCDISNEASKITGISFCHATNKMYLNGREVETCTIQQGLLDF